MATLDQRTGHHQESVVESPTRLNLGCGHVTPEGWINVDGSNRAWLASKFPLVDRILVSLRIIRPTEFSSKTKFANLLKRFPWEDNSIDAIYMGEILEHFTKSEAQHVIAECYRVLKMDGLLRIRVPDNARFWRNYLEEYNAVRQCPRSQWNLKHTRWIEMFFDNICVHRPKQIQSMGHYHKWMYDEVSLTLSLESAGFKDVERMGLHDSKILGIELVETRDDLTVEAVKSQT